MSTRSDLRFPIGVGLVVAMLALLVLTTAVYNMTEEAVARVAWMLVLIVAAFFIVTLVLVVARPDAFPGRAASGGGGESLSADRVTQIVEEKLNSMAQEFAVDLGRVRTDLRDEVQAAVKPLQTDVAKLADSMAEVVKTLDGLAPRTRRSRKSA